MFLDWLRFDRRLLQFIKLWDLPNIIHIYRWWTLIFWPLEWSLGILHLIGVGHLLQFLLRIGSRPLNAQEKSIAMSIFQQQVPLDLVRINNSSRFAKKNRIAFVSGYIINYHRGIPNSIFVHELTHVYQYYKVGMVYIPRCLFAQVSQAGYDFGAVDDHVDIIEGSEALRKLNYEQQAEFIEQLYMNDVKSRTLVHQDSAFKKFNFHV